VTSAVFNRLQVHKSPLAFHEFLADNGFHVRKKETLRFAVKMKPGRSLRIETPVIYDEFSHAIPSFGSYSYFGSGCRFHFVESIGRFCSIGHGVRIGPTEHNLTALSTHNFFGARDGFIARTEEATAYRTDNPKLFERLAKAAQSHREGLGLAYVGNDVWIGDNVTVLAGVRIADGCVLGVGAVVTKDTEPYGIYGGIPARLIRHRFPKEICTRLAATKWWDYPVSTLNGIDLSEIEKNIGKIEKAVAKAKLAERTAVKIEGKPEDLKVSIVK